MTYDTNKVTYIGHEYLGNNQNAHIGETGVHDAGMFYYTVGPISSAFDDVTRTTGELIKVTFKVNDNVPDNTVLSFQVKPSMSRMKQLGNDNPENNDGKQWYDVSTTGSSLSVTISNPINTLSNNVSANQNESSRDNSNIVAGDTEEDNDIIEVAEELENDKVIENEDISEKEVTKINDNLIYIYMGAGVIICVLGGIVICIKVLKTKRKIIIFCCIFVLVILASCAAVLFAFNRYRINQIELINDVIAIEYGEKYDIVIENLIDLNKYSYINTSSIEIIFDIENEEDKEYLAVGEYTIVITYKSIYMNKELNQRLIVGDTTPPELTFSQESMEITAGNNLPENDIRALLSAYDLAELKEYNIDISGVDINVAGEYFVKVSIEDINENMTERELMVIVKEKPKQSSSVQKQPNINNLPIFIKPYEYTPPEFPYYNPKSLIP